MSRYSILPKLSVPDLSDSLNRFLTAMKPLTTQSQFSQLVNATDSFSKKEGTYLQNKLITLSEDTDNWASRVWVDTRYLSNRDSLIFTNGKTTLRSKLNWSSTKEMLLAISQHLFKLVKVLEVIRDDRLPQEMLGNVPQSMSQYKRLVGGYRLPKPTIDTQTFSPNSKHIVVLHAGRIYRMQVYNPADGDRCLSVEEMYQLLSQVVSCVSEDTQGNLLPVSLLTALDRDSWYSAREQLIEDSPVNADSLREIETSLFGLCIDESCENENDDDNIKRVRFGDNRLDFKHYNRWFGLGLHTIFTKDGLETFFTEHSMLDGILNRFYETIPTFPYPSVNSLSQLDTDLRLRPLSWELSEISLREICSAKSKLSLWYKDYDTVNIDFTGFGKNLIKRYGVYTQGFIQLAIQLAYYRLYNQLTASYQTVSLKSYREGRLEHPITVSEEIETFVESMTIRSLSDKERWKLMLRAIHTYRQLLSDTSKGHVFVKHIQALRYLAERENLSVDLFQDSHFKLFIQPKLAVSSIHSTLPLSATYPLFNGHFVGVHPNSDSLFFFITTMTSRSPKSSLQLYREIEWSLNTLRHLMEKDAHID